MKLSTFTFALTFYLIALCSFVCPAVPTEKGNYSEAAEELTQREIAEHIQSGKEDDIKILKNMKHINMLWVLSDKQMEVNLLDLSLDCYQKEKNEKNRAQRAEIVNLLLNRCTPEEIYLDEINLELLPINNPELLEKILKKDSTGPNGNILHRAAATNFIKTFFVLCEHAPAHLLNAYDGSNLTPLQAFLTHITVTLGPNSGDKEERKQKIAKYREDVFMLSRKYKMKVCSKQEYDESRVLNFLREGATKKQIKKLERILKKPFKNYRFLCSVEKSLKWTSVGMSICFILSLGVSMRKLLKNDKELTMFSSLLLSEKKMLLRKKLKEYFLTFGRKKKILLFGTLSLLTYSTSLIVHHLKNYI